MEQFFTDLIDRLADMHEQYIDYMEGLSTGQLDWSPGEEMNSMCVLAVHVTQAERYWIGLGVGDPIKRDRPAEFQASGHTVDELKALFQKNMTYYKSIFPNLSVSNFDETVTVDLFPEDTWDCTRSWTLLHALDHTAEHLGHMGMTRQLLNSQQ